MIRVRLYGAARELAGRSTVELDLPDGTPAARVLEKLFEELPTLAPYGDRLHLAVNRQFARGDEPVTNATEVALLPPLGGGEPTFRLTREPLDPASVFERVRRLEAGAVVLFVGTVRAGRSDRPVRALVYEAYEAMALEELERLAAELRSRQPDVEVAGVHRLGRVDVGEPSVVLAASAPHRAEAFAACRWMLEQLKARVPIFKKEIFADGVSRWVGLDPEDGTGSNRSEEPSEPAEPQDSP